MKGKTSRDKGIEGQKTPAKSSDLVKKVSISEPVSPLPDLSEEEEYITPGRKPTLNEMPGFTRKGRAVEIPSFLKRVWYNK